MVVYLTGNDQFHIIRKSVTELYGIIDNRIYHSRLYPVLSFMRKAEGYNDNDT